MINIIVYFFIRSGNLNVSAKPIWRSQLTLGKLVSALNYCIDNENIQKTVTACANSIDREKNMALTVRNLTG